MSRMAVTPSKPQIVPFSRQAAEVLKEIEPLTGRGRYVFQSLRTPDRPMSDNTILAALRRMGYAKEEMSGHGFRAMASTLLHEQGGHRTLLNDN
jgi:integrase